MFRGFRLRVSGPKSRKHTCRQYLCGSWLRSLRCSPRTWCSLETHFSPCETNDYLFRTSRPQGLRNSPGSHQSWQSNDLQFQLFRGVGSEWRFKMRSCATSSCQREVVKRHDVVEQGSWMFLALYKPLLLRSSHRHWTARTVAARDGSAGLVFICRQGL